MSLDASKVVDMYEGVWRSHQRHARACARRWLDADAEAVRSWRDETLDLSAALKIMDALAARGAVSSAQRLAIALCGACVRHVPRLLVDWLDARFPRSDVLVRQMLRVLRHTPEGRAFLLASVPRLARTACLRKSIHEYGFPPDATPGDERASWPFDAAYWTRAVLAPRVGLEVLRTTPSTVARDRLAPYEAMWTRCVNEITYDPRQYPP